MEHELKVWPSYFARIADGSKTFEIRKNDRGFQAGDVLVLREWDPSRSTYTGSVLRHRVGFVAAGTLFGLTLGEHVVLSLLPDDGEADRG